MVKVLVCISCFFTLLVTFGCSRYYQFDELYDKSDYLRAYSVLDQIKNKKNSNYDRRYYRVIIRLALDGDSDFLERLKTITRGTASGELENYLDFGRTYLQFLDSKTPQNYSEIITNLTDIHKTPEEFVSYAYKIRGISYFKNGKYPEAIADLNQSYRMIPNVDNLYFIGMSYYNKEDYKQAATYFNRVIDGTQNQDYRSLAYFQLGEIEYYQNRYELALEKYILAINTNPESADYAYKIAKCLQKLKYNGLSPRFLKTALRIQKDYANAWFFLNIY